MTARVVVPIRNKLVIRSRKWVLFNSKKGQFCFKCIDMEYELHKSSDGAVTNVIVRSQWPSSMYKAL